MPRCRPRRGSDGSMPEKCLSSDGPPRRGGGVGRGLVGCAPALHLCLPVEGSERSPGKISQCPEKVSIVDRVVYTRRGCDEKKHPLWEVVEADESLQKPWNTFGKKQLLQLQADAAQVAALDACGSET